MKKLEWNRFYNVVTTEKRSNRIQKLTALIFLILLIFVYSLMIVFIVRTIENPVAIIVNILFAMILLNAILTIKKYFGFCDTSQNENEKILQDIGDLIRRDLNYKKRIVFKITNNYNAYASKSHGIIGTSVVTIGIPLLLTNEIEAIKVIIAHEITHLKNRDNFFGGLVDIMLSWSEDIFYFVNPFSRYQSPNHIWLITLAKGLLFIVLGIFLIFIYLARYSVRWINYSMEYAADFEAIKYLGTEKTVRAMILLGYLEYFKNNITEENYNMRLERFLSWLPIEEKYGLSWIKKSEETFSHPSTNERYNLAISMNEEGTISQENNLIINEKIKLLMKGVKIAT